MTVQEKLRLIQRLSGLNQTELARELGVTFAAFNRWVTGKAAPRPRAQARIDRLYQRYSGVKEIPATVQDAKLGIISRKQQAHPDVIREIIKNPDIRDQFYLSLTYHSNRIEGSSLTENETAAILFAHAALPRRSLVEHLEAKNHQTALEYLFRSIAEGKPLSKALILKLHSILMNGIHDEAGLYRRHAVRIVGANVPTANYPKVPMLMEQLVREAIHKRKDEIRHAASIHARFEQIHPFADGNGRVGRLFMHAMMLKANLPPAVIRQERRRKYNQCLYQAQVEESLEGLTGFIVDAVFEGYRILGRGKL